VGATSVRRVLTDRARMGDLMAGDNMGGRLRRGSSIKADMRVDNRYNSVPTVRAATATVRISGLASRTAPGPVPTRPKARSGYTGSTRSPPLSRTRSAACAG